MKRTVTIIIFTLLWVTVLGAVTAVRADGTLLWQANIPSTGEPVSSPILVSGRLYMIVAKELFLYGHGPNWYQLQADAQYYMIAPSNYWVWTSPYYFPAPEGHSFLEINGIDVHWGPFSNGDTGHTYKIYYMGRGQPITFAIVDWMDGDYTNGDYTKNTCHLPVRIYELPPCAGSPRTIGFWKSHPDAWPVGSLTVGGVTYTKDQALQILKNANAKDATSMLAAQLIAAKLNVFNNACPASSPVFDTYAMNDADTFLVAHPLGSNPRGADRTYALMLKDILDGFNNGR